jgi:SpoVK/Ycf46/Vps4 family AAA+-type ATPase
MIQAPQELLHKGRWDELFFVDLPNETERQAIWQMVIRRCDCDPNEFDTAQFAKALAGPTGSEIEQASVKLLDQAFDEETERTDLTIATMVNDLDKLGEEELICVRVQVLAHSVLRPANQTRNSPRRVPSLTAFSPFVCKPLMHF